MDELVLSDKKYISVKRAAELTKYAKDYIGQLARSGKISATRFGRAWYVEESSILKHMEGGASEAQASNEPKVYSVDSKALKQTVPSHFYRPTQLPRTWSPITYMHDDSPLIPTLSISNAPELKKASEDEAEDHVRIRVLRSSIQPKAAIARVAHQSGKPGFRKVKRQVFSHHGVSFAPFVLAGSAAVAIFIASGLFISSDAHYSMASDQYVAGVLFSFDNLKTILADSPFLQAGIGAVSAFINVIASSFWAYFSAGLNFIEHIF